MAGVASPSTVRRMSRADVAWLAGLMEGEGSFLLLRRHGGTVVAPRLSLGSTDYDILERIVTVTGVGSVAPVSEQANRLGTKPMWHWRLSRREDVRALCVALRPWMGKRRTEQVDAILDHLRDVPAPRAGYCAKGLHEMTPANRAPNGGAGTCRACLNARRRAQAATRRAAPCTEP